MKKYIIPILLALAVIASFASYHKGYKKGISKAVETIITVRDTLTRIDTVVREKPVYLTSVVVDTLRVPVPVPGKADTLYGSLPRERKTYAEDSLYVCEISGVQPELESITVFPKTTTITVTNTVKEYTNPRFSLGVQAGYGVSKEGLSPYIGVGISYNIVNFKGRP